MRSLRELQASFAAALVALCLVPAWFLPRKASTKAVEAAAMVQ